MSQRLRSSSRLSLFFFPTKVRGFGTQRLRSSTDLSLFFFPRKGLMLLDSAFTNFNLSVFSFFFPHQGSSLRDSAFAIFNSSVFIFLSPQRFDATGLSVYRSALCACVVKDIPNVSDYVYKPQVTTTKRKRPSSKASGTDNDSSATTSSPEGTTPQPVQQADDNLLNQLA